MSYTSPLLLLQLLLPLLPFASPVELASPVSPVKILLLPLLLPLVSPVELGRRTPPWPHPYWDIPGDYCRAKYPAMDCCSGRQDRCSVPILGTLCYCDSFCNRTINADCCPDYFPHCEGLEVDDRYQAAENPPESIALPPGNCEHGILNNSYP